MPARVAWSPEQLALFERKGPKGRRPARGKPKPALERATHIALADLLRAQARPDVFWTALEAGEYRTEKTGALLKRKGVKPGVPDFMFLSARGVAFLELKRGRMGSLSAAQALFGSLMLEYGVPYAVAYSFNEAEAQLRNWHVLRPEARGIR
jgi:hypothetical protein